MIKQFIKQNKIVLIFASAIIFSFAIKACCMYFYSLDMTGALLPWCHRYHNLNGIECLRQVVTDYPPIYNYFIMAISHIFPDNDVVFMHAIKTFSILFDIINATAVYFIVKHCSNNKLISACSFAFVLIAPDVIVNSAAWGQCDIIYTSFILWFIYFILKNKSHLAMVFLSFAFCNKIQSVFILPFVLYLIFKRKVKIYQLLYIPAIYLLVGIPELVAGQPFKQVILPYTNFPSVNLYNPNIYFWVPFTGLNENAILNYFAIGFAAVILLSAVIYCFVKKVELNNENIIFLSFASCFLATFVMPKMHERYFFLAEMISIVYFFVKRSKASVILMISTIITATVASLNVLLGFSSAVPDLTLRIINSANMVFSLGSLSMMIYEFIHTVAPKKVEPLLENI